MNDLVSGPVSEIVDRVMNNIDKIFDAPIFYNGYPYGFTNCQIGAICQVLRPLILEIVQAEYNKSMDKLGDSDE